MSENTSVNPGVFIDGSWQDCDAARLVSQSPIDGSEVAAFSVAGEDAAGRAIDAAVAAQSEWADLSAHDRGAYLRDAASVVEDRKEELSRLLTREMGKTIGAARGELQRTIDLLNYYAEVARDAGGEAPPSASQNTLTYTLREPWGTAGIITPWNYPIAIPTWKIAPALVAGNTVVFKPASSTPAIGAELVAALKDAGIPDGVINFVPGSGSSVGDTIVTDENIDVVSFTGSYQVGHDVQESATQSGKRVQCEMGGKNPILIDDTADLDLAVQLTIDGGIAGLAGQACTATSRAIVFESVHDEYLDRLVTAIEDLTVGDPLDEETDVGPKYSESGLETDLEYIKAGREEGATLVTGGKRLTGGSYDDGYFVEPTVFADVDPEIRIAQEEIFGPVLSVIEVADYDEAIAVANGVDYGLSAALCTNRLDRTQEFADRIETGVVKINQTSTGVEMQLPFGGRKNSSSETFKEQGRQALEFYTHKKAVYVTHTAESD